MSTITADRRTADLITLSGRLAVNERRNRNEEPYVPWNDHAPRSATRIAMQARREQDRRQSGW